MVDKMEFMPNEIAILNEKVVKDLPLRVGQRVTILDKYYTTNNFDYYVEFDDGEKTPVKSDELIKLTDEHKKYMDFIFTGNKILYWLDEVTIVKVDYLNKQANIQFCDSTYDVVDFDKLNPIEQSKQAINVNYFEQKGLEIGQLVNKKQVAYGDSISKAYKLMQVYLESYDNGNDTYTIPKSLLKHILLQIRIIDKQNRIFNNPDGDLMEENSYADTVGYGLLGMRMIDENN